MKLTKYLENCEGELKQYSKSDDPNIEYARGYITGKIEMINAILSDDYYEIDKCNEYRNEKIGITILDNLSKDYGKYLKCETCGKQDETVIKTICPYAKEINNIEIDAILCDDCYRERCLDI